MECLGKIGLDNCRRILSGAPGRHIDAYHRRVAAHLPATGAARVLEDPPPYSFLLWPDHHRDHRQLRCRSGWLAVHRLGEEFHVDLGQLGHATPAHCSGHTRALRSTRRVQKRVGRPERDGRRLFRGTGRSYGGEQQPQAPTATETVVEQQRKAESALVGRSVGLSVGVSGRVTRHHEPIDCYSAGLKEAFVPTLLGELVIVRSQH